MQINQSLIRVFLIITSFLLLACHNPYLEKKDWDRSENQPNPLADFSNANYSDSEITVPLIIRNKKNINGTVSAGFLSIGKKMIFCTYNGFLYTMDKGTFAHSGSTRPARGINAMPALFRDRLFLSAEWLKFGLSAYDFSTQKIVWQDKKGYSVTSPIIHDNRLYIAQKDGRVRSLNPITFQEIWHFDTNEPILSNLALGQKYLYVLTTKGKLFALIHESGTQSWTIDIGEAIKTNPVLIDRFLMIAGLSGKLYLVDTDSRSLEMVSDLQSPVFRSPSAGNGMFFIGTSSGRLIAYDPVHKHIQWDKNLEGPISISPLVLKSKIAIGTDQKKLYILDQTDGTILQELDMEGRLSCLPLPFDQGLILGLDFRKLIYLKKE